MEEMPILVSLAIVMLVGSYLAGSIPLFFTFSEVSILQICYIGCLWLPISSLLVNNSLTVSILSIHNVNWKKEGQPYITKPIKITFLLISTFCFNICLCIIIKHTLKASCLLIQCSYHQYQVLNTQIKVMLVPTVNIMYWAAAMFVGALASGMVPLIYAFQEVIQV